ncbi:glycosyltransferase family 4 protein [Caulobacter sp. Root1472]|uniref:glycosyltransferase family 4 protein n=1 Tax=Caulobacter sp. Root1472 TaxID=1736470 RepID=UPI0009E6BA38|nr:glycosyltransferase family 4 protein [Caulobacter sp. Root1472]
MSQRSSSSTWSLGSVAAAWRRLPVPPSLRRNLARPIYQALSLMAHLARWPAPRPVASLTPGDLVVSSFAHEVMGLGSGARMTLAGLRQAGLEPISEDIGFLRTEPLYDHRPLPGRPAGGVWISQCNPPEMDRLFFAHRAANLAQRYRIGYWAWELERPPASWARSARGLNEIWTPSQFVCDAVRKIVPPDRHDMVKVVPHPSRDMTGVQPDRTGLKLPQNAMVVLVMADLRSTSARKNPKAAIDAFLRAFPEPTDRAHLVCKLVAHEAAPEEYARLESALGKRPDVTLMTDHLSDSDVWRLMASSDVLLSLHRSEGYGLALAEAMQLERCVVATGWSGNMDFMDNDCGVLVPYQLTPVGSQAGPYSTTGGRWAEPDVEFAAQALRSLLADPARRTRLGHEAAKRINDHQARFHRAVADAPWRSLLIRN